MRQVCVVAENELSLTGKSCERVECESDGDCCATFVPSPACDIYEAACEADPSDCASYNALCVCTRACQDQLCTEPRAACTEDADCGLFDAPVCVEGRCVECREHGDCFAAGDRCVGGTCAAGCASDDDCSPLHACQGGECTLVGCASDRECALLLKDPRAACREDKSCAIPCSSAAECDISALETCHEGSCVFVGCESDSECRAFLELDPSDPGRAVCR